MGTFVTQETTPTLFESGPKEAGAQRVPSNLTTKNVTDADDMNNLANGLQDVRTAIRGREINVLHYGAIGDGVTDDTSAIQAALVAAGNGATKRGVYFPSGTYLVSNTLRLYTSTFIRGESYISTKIKMSALPSGSKPTYEGSTDYTPTLDYFPILWNASPVQWFGIDNITLDGNDLDVYGLRLQENFYGDISNLHITNCNKHPYINIRGQLVNHQNVSVYENAAGVLFYNWTAITFAACGFERNTGTFYLQMRQPSAAFNKGSLDISGCWFEGSTGVSPSTAFFGFGGRAISGRGLFFTLGDTFTSQRGLYAFPTGNALTVDNINMAAAPATGATLEQVNYTDTMATYLGASTSGCFFSGQLNSTNTADDSGNTTNTVRFIGSGIDWPYVHGRWQARRTYTSNPSVATTNFNIDVQDDIITFFTQANNWIKNNSGILELAANTNLRLLSGIAAGQNVAIQNRSGLSTYESGHITMGSYHLWIDTGGALRIKSSAPSSTTDGTAIGASLSGSATWDPGNLADGAGETSAAITATSAALGDFVLVSAPYDLQGITCNGYVSATNEVKIRLQNETGGAIDLASGTWRVRVIKQ